MLRTLSATWRGATLVDSTCSPIQYLLRSSWRQSLRMYKRAARSTKIVTKLCAPPWMYSRKHPPKLRTTARALLKALMYTTLTEVFHCRPHPRSATTETALAWRNHINKSNRAVGGNGCSEQVEPQDLHNHDFVGAAPRETGPTADTACNHSFLNQVLDSRSDLAPIAVPRSGFSDDMRMP